MRKIKNIAILIAMLCLASGCAAKEPKKLSDLIPRSQEEAFKRVMIPEVDGEASYLVLGQYFKNQGIFLMREDLSSDAVAFNVMSDNYWNSYYEDSLLDKYMESFYNENLTPEMQSLVLQVDVEVCEKTNGAPTLKKELISRKVFAPSDYEAGTFKFAEYLKEGKQVKYFFDSGFKIAKYNGVKCGWWTRTWDFHEIYVRAFASNGEQTQCQIETEFGARPAFCLSGSLKIIEDELNGQTVYRLVD
jgi:hypothetical protein